MAKFLLIDGQQRITTVYLILMAIKDLYKERGEQEKYEEIKNIYLANPYKRGNDYYKMKTIITKKLSIVSIVLDATDNPYLVFESLNHKGKRKKKANIMFNCSEEEFFEGEIKDMILKLLQADRYAIYKWLSRKYSPSPQGGDFFVMRTGK